MPKQRSFEYHGNLSINLQTSNLSTNVVVVFNV